MNHKLSQRDFETLSAYLDNQLNTREKSRFERRLRSETSLQHALRDLKNTRRVLRAAPKMRTPRNFTLTPEMVQDQSRLSLPVFRLAFALASLMFVLSLVGHYAFGPSLDSTTVAFQAEAPAPGLTLEANAQEELQAAEEAAEEESGVAADEVMEAQPESAQPAEGMEAPESLGVVEEPSQTTEEDANRAAGGEADTGIAEAQEQSAVTKEVSTLKRQRTSLPKPGTQRQEPAGRIFSLWLVSAGLFGAIAVFSGAALLFRRRRT